MPYPYDQVFAADPATPENVASNGVVTIFAPGDPERAPLAITTLDGLPLPNPLQVNDAGFGPAFMHETLDQVAWAGGGFSGLFVSYKGMKDEAVAARRAAEAAVTEVQSPTDQSVDRGILRADIPGKVADQIANGPIMAGVVAGYAKAPGNPVNAALVDVTGVSSSDLAHTTKIVPKPGRNGLFVRNEQNSYAVKIDQYDNNGAHDTVNVVANFGGAHTVVGIGSGNTEFSTVKITNHGPQIAGQIVAALGTNPDRTAGIFGADNWGKGPSFVASSKGGDNIAFRAAYDPGVYSNSILWATGHHVGGALVNIENDGAHSSGSMLRLAESSPAATVPIISIVNAGAGETISAPSFSVLKDGRTKLKQIENFSSFNNGQVKLNDSGIVADRNVADASPVVKVQNIHASSTGDILQLVKTGGVVATRVSKDGSVITKVNAAPADVDLSIGECALWIDPTPSTGGVRWKIKAADGTIINKSL